MLRTYIAVVDKLGLRSLHTETEHTLQTLVQQAAPAMTILVWSLLEDSIAEQVWLSLSHGNRRDAWRFLEAHAHDIGTVSPTEYHSALAA